MKDYKHLYSKEYLMKKEENGIIGMALSILLLLTVLSVFFIKLTDTLPPTPEERNCTAEYYTPLCDEEKSNERNG